MRREITGGAATFFAMAYIVVVNPAILAAAGLPIGPSTVATILTAVFGTLLMGLWANRPIAVAPYMGENAFLAFGLAALDVTWQQRLGTVFVAGFVFLLLAALGIGPWLARSIPTSLKHAFAVGIGLFLMLVGLYEAGIVTSGAAGLPAAGLTVAGGLLRAPPAALRLGDMRDGRDYDSQWGTRMKGTGPLAWMIGRRFESACAKLGLNKRRTRLTTEHFARPRRGGQQLALFD